MDNDTGKTVHHNLLNVPGTSFECKTHMGLPEACDLSHPGGKNSVSSTISERLLLVFNHFKVWSCEMKTTSHSPQAKWYCYDQCPL